MDGNGQTSPYEERLTRAERLIAHVMDEHESFRAELHALLAAQVVFQGRQEETKKIMDDLGLKQKETEEKLNALIDLVDRDHRAFEQRLRRLEAK